MIDFNNTEIAFKGKTNKELQKASFMFSHFFSKRMISVATFLINIALFIRFPLNFILKPNVFKHFCGGEDLNECSNTVNSLHKFNIKSILDYSVEAESSNSSVQKSYNEIQRTIENASKEPEKIPFSVFKPTSLVDPGILEMVSMGKSLNESELFQFNMFKELILGLAQNAFDNKVKLLVDAEDYAYQKAIDDVVLDLMRKFNKEWPCIINTFQMYRHDRLAYLQSVLVFSKNEGFILGAKLVRGAYLEKERNRAEQLNFSSPINPNKETTDNHFNKGLELIIKNLNHSFLFCGTHNEESCLLLVNLMTENNLEKNDIRIWFAQLYGMSDHISFNLAADGYNVAKYIPYGPVKSVIPYLLRRASENSSVKGQTGRELQLLNNELKRRKEYEI